MPTGSHRHAPSPLVQMIYSMTGYASASRELATTTLHIELRSVNHRYLDLQFRMPDELRALEPALRELITAKIQRGKVECRINLAPLPGAQKAFELNADVLKQLRALSEQLRLSWPSVAGLTAADILRWPGMLGSDAISPDELRSETRELLLTVLDDFSETRAREGEKLKQILLERADAMGKVIADVTPRLPEILAAYDKKLSAKLIETLGENAGANIDERVRQEVALFATRIDVDEELSRLNAHLKELRRILDAESAAGKRLDFLMQELNREANTLGSKSVAVETTRASLDLKLLIEQMREQIQNIE